MTLTDILSTALSAVLECFILIYYSNSVMNYRHSRMRSDLIIIAGYTIYFGICLLENMPLNICAFVVINFCVLKLGYKDNTGTCVLRVVVLTILMMFGEFMTALIMRIDISDEFYSTATIAENYIIVTASKLIYFIAVIMLRRFSVRREEEYSSVSFLWLLILPATTILFMVFYGRILSGLAPDDAAAVSVILIMLMLSNFVVYAVNDRIIDTGIRIRQLQEISSKNELDHKSYELIKEKYEALRIVAHDFNKYCNNIEALLTVDQGEALAQLQKIKNKNKELLLVEYTNNKALNLLLSQKIQECGRLGVDIQICVRDVDMSFIEETDIVSIFANLIDNAIESSIESQNKKIFLNLYTMNEAYIVIRVDNSADSEPVVSDGRLNTRKKNKEQHGIGITSITNALSNYQGKLRWSYDKASKVFTTIALINQQSSN